jgi:hypothetical protein
LQPAARTAQTRIAAVEARSRIERRVGKGSDPRTQRSGQLRTHKRLKRDARVALTVSRG